MSEGNTLLDLVHLKKNIDYELNIVINDLVESITKIKRVTKVEYINKNNDDALILVTCKWDGESPIVKVYPKLDKIEITGFTSEFGRNVAARVRCKINTLMNTSKI